MFEKVFETMSDEKIKKVAVGAIAGGTVLVLVLMAVLLYQLIAMWVTSARIDTVKEEIAKTEQTIAQMEGDLGYYKTDDYKERAARQHGVNIVNK